MAARIEGLAAIASKLTREIEGIKGRSLRGVHLAAEAVRGDAIVLTPVDLGPLRASALATSEMTLRGPRAAVSYNTEYAVRQHEDLSYNHTVGEAKFLEKAATRNEGRVRDIIAREARIP